jgi:alginate O-acetyltransferase complex protein AlgI
MLFSSETFLFLFLPLFLIVYNLFACGIPERVANKTYYLNIVLFIFSFIFYAWGEGVVVLILLLSAGINFFAGYLISIGYRRLGIYLSLFGSLSLLFYFKYSHFFFSIFNLSFVSVSLPIGISFYTFQGISYTLDIYWGRIKANKNFINFGTYLAMFPHQIAGPVVRYADIEPELKNRRVSIQSFSTGSERFMIGLAKKILIANTFAKIADDVFSTSTVSVYPVVAWLGAISYMFQIYFDFSGYSDMAIGLGRMIGFDFKENFNYPYTARSIQDFWRRWHISLSGWFRDYVYIPLGGNRHSQLRTYSNLLLVFLITGLWHGASWNFIFWGLYHGLFLLIERIGLNKILATLPRPLSLLYTWIVVLIGWVFFRANDLSAAYIYLQNMLGLAPDKLVTAHSLSYFLTPELVIAFVLAFLFSMPTYIRIELSINRLRNDILSLSSPIIVFLLFILSIMYIAAGTYNPFIYFRF